MIPMFENIRMMYRKVIKTEQVDGGCAPPVQYVCYERIEDTQEQREHSFNLTLHNQEDRLCS